MATYAFNPPSRPGPRGGPHPLFRRMQIPYGIGVFKISGTYRQIENPGDEHYSVATEIYLGGHRYTVAGATADALIAAGYGEFLTLL